MGKPARLGGSASAAADADAFGSRLNGSLDPRIRLGRKPRRALRIRYATATGCPDFAEATAAFTVAQMARPAGASRRVSVSLSIA